MFLSISQVFLPLGSGTSQAPLSSSDVTQEVASSNEPGTALLPNVTMVFCSVDGGKQFVSRHRRDAQMVHNVLVSMLRSVLQQVLLVYYNRCFRQQTWFLIVHNHISTLMCAFISHMWYPGGRRLFRTAAGWRAEVHGCLPLTRGNARRHTLSL